MKRYLSAPLPFVGQKRMFAKDFIKVLSQYSDDTVFVDLFGGSGLLSHIAKREKPNSTVIYNDFDGYRRRLDNIERTNQLLANLRTLTLELPRHKVMPSKVKEKIIQLIAKEEERGFVDYITLSSSLLFSMKYVLSLGALKKETFYNNIRKSDYSADGYLDELNITSCDYKELVAEYGDNPNVVFFVDPPYLSTDVGTYNMYWKLGDYLDVLRVLNGKRFIYFTSNKSSIIELCEWLGDNPSIGNPFQNCKKVEFNAHVNHNSSYTDIMIHNAI